MQKSWKAIFLGAAFAATAAIAQMPVTVMDGATPQSAEQRLESILLCKDTVNPKKRAMQLLSELGFRLVDGVYQPPKGKRITLFGHEVIHVSLSMGTSAILKTRKFHALAKQLGFKKNEFRNDDTGAHYLRMFTSYGTSLHDGVGPNERTLGIEISCGLD